MWSGSPFFRYSQVCPPSRLRAMRASASWVLRHSPGLAIAPAMNMTSGFAGGATNDFIAGSGNSYAQVFRVGPTAGRLSLAPVVGLSLADYLDTPRPRPISAYRGLSAAFQRWYVHFDRTSRRL